MFQKIKDIYYIMTRKIKLFETFSDQILEFKDKIVRGGTWIWIYNPPAEIRNNSVEGGTVEWAMQLDITSFGLDEPKVWIKKLDFELELEKETEDDDWETEKISLTADGTLNKTRCTFEGFPIFLRDINIDMHHSIDPEDWTYELEMGDRPEDK